MVKTYDILIIGAGIIGLSIARELKLKSPDSSIVILEKDSDVALHGSGRNSGVLHTGFYYTSNSLKAKFTASGNKSMKDYCYENGLRINECGKVVIAKNELEIDGLNTLIDRGVKNGVVLSLIDSHELAEIEPNAKTFEKALYSPSTATVDPVEISQCLKSELLKKGVSFFLVRDFLGKRMGILS